MRFGKISATLLGVTAATMVTLIVLRPGNPLATLGGLLVIFSYLSALIVGILGIICDRHKLLAIITTIIAGGCLLFHLVVVGIIMTCSFF